MKRIRTIVYLVRDLPRDERRTRRGVLTDMLSKVTGLATEGELD